MSFCALSEKDVHSATVSPPGARVPLSGWYFSAFFRLSVRYHPSRETVSPETFLSSTQSFFFAS